MFASYIDESDNRLVYYVGALTISTDNAAGLSDEFEELAEKHFNEFQFSKIPEFHGYDMLGGEGDWRSLKQNYAAQKQVFSECLNLILSHEFVLNIKGVSRGTFVPKYGNNPEDLHHAALTWNLEKVHDYLKNIDSRTFLIADQIGKQEHRTQSSVSNYKKSGTFGWRSTVLDRVMDTIYFCPSSDSRLLQAIDVLLHTYVKRVTPHKDARAQMFCDSQWEKVVQSGKIRSVSTW